MVADVESVRRYTRFGSQSHSLKRERREGTTSPLLHCQHLHVDTISFIPTVRKAVRYPSAMPGQELRLLAPDGGDFRGLSLLTSNVTRRLEDIGLEERKKKSERRRMDHKGLKG